MTSVKPFKRENQLDCIFISMLWTLVLFVFPWLAFLFASIVLSVFLSRSEVSTDTAASSTKKNLPPRNSPIAALKSDVKTPKINNQLFAPIVSLHIKPKVKTWKVHICKQKHLGERIKKVFFTSQPESKSLWQF